MLKEMHWTNLATIILYMLAVVLIGAWFSRSEDSSEEYLLGGRKMVWWAVGISYMMSLLSTVSLVMVPGEIYNHGLSLYVLAPLYPLTAILMYWIFVRFYFKMGVFTPFTYLERRFSRSFRVLTSILYLWTRLIYLGMVLFSSSKVFEGAAGWPAWFTITIVGVVGIVYTMLGGMKAVIWTDVMQFVALFLGLGITIAICAHHIDGGLWGGIRYAIDHGHGASMYTKREFYTLDPYVRLCFWILLIGKFTEPMFYSTADQISVQRLLSTSSFKNGFRAMLVNALAGIPFTFMMWAIGLIIFAYYAQHPDPNVTQGDTAFFTFVATKLPAPIPGLMLAAMLAAVMSTLDSGMNSLSAVGLKDIYLPFVNPNAAEKKQVLVARLLTLLIGAIAMGLALCIATSSKALGQSIVEAGVIWAALGGVVVPVFLVGFTTRGVDAAVAWLATMLTWGVNFGMTTWYVASKRPEGLTGPIGLAWPVVPLLAGILFGLAVLAYRKRSGRLAFRFALPATLFAGYTGAMLFWYLASHHLGGGVLSFQWVGLPGLLTYLAFCYGSLLVRRNVIPRNTIGLTLWTRDEPIAD
ncbi:MAG: sodium/solute symporter [Lentisphaerae bacterium]|jgi:SSS family transporter|nr:sodium/solute symporter [Lentisphaerota bacterium]MBT5609337.1 sodium/solute symporter [Lentisphaerota bacterium]MBT7054737.1 sodium/solute symporter [Lentisphaerota bacterium]MBT7847950.1 sodium/solute symporter [Lentisphaerota bacterium]